ncbi:MAG: CsgG/HfaB family protein [Limnohabitans sp.]
MALFFMKNWISWAILCAALMACSDKKEEPLKADSDQPNLAISTPDVGKVEHIEVKTTGTGLTPTEAVNEALKSAVMQVNGAAVDASSASLNISAKATAQLDVQTKNGSDFVKTTEVLNSHAFAESVVTQSNGVVSTFKVDKLTPPKSKGGVYIVDITANIAKFKAPANAGKIKIVVAPLKSTQQSFNIGGRNIPAHDVLEPIRQQIIESLTKTGRFTVLDRDFGSEIESELGMIGSGQTTQNDLAKLNQALSADVIWVGAVNTLSYDRLARQLKTSDKELVSYSGKWSITQRLVNLTTRQVMLSDTFNGDFPTVSPTTLGASINEKTSIVNVQNEVVKKATESIMQKTFPISVVSIDGESVVLSQGEGAVVEGGQYKLVKLGKEMKDPQTGQSLGNMEADCCEVIVNRVTEKMSYGQLTNVKVKLEGIEAGVLQIRGKALIKAVEQSSPASAPSNKPKVTPIASGEKITAPTAEKAKDKDW